MARGRGRLFEGGDYFKYFGQRAGAINRGTAIIRGNMVCVLLEQGSAVYQMCSPDKYVNP